MKFAVDFRLPDFKRILVNRDFHPFLVHDADNGEVVALSNWKVTAPVKPTSHLGVKPTYYRTLTTAEKLWSWLYWTRDKLAKLYPDWLYKLLRPGTYDIYERKRRWFVKVLDNFNNSVQESDKPVGYWTLMHLGVNPQYSGRGIASALLQWGLDNADAEDRAIYIIATMAGSKLYSKYGFQAVSSDVYFEGEPFGGFEEIMMRRARISERKET